MLVRRREEVEVMRYCDTRLPPLETAHVTCVRIFCCCACDTQERRKLILPRFPLRWAHSPFSEARREKRRMGLGQSRTSGSLKSPSTFVSRYAAICVQAWLDGARNVLPGVIPAKDGIASPTIFSARRVSVSDGDPTSEMMLPSKKPELQSADTPAMPPATTRATTAATAHMFVERFMFLVVTKMQTAFNERNHRYTHFSLSRSLCLRVTRLHCHERDINSRAHKHTHTSHKTHMHGSTSA